MMTRADAEELIENLMGLLEDRGAFNALDVQEEDLREELIDQVEDWADECGF